jgi:hypothetical protein
MARSAKTAADGTQRAPEPYMDAAGQWCCPACGRASGFSSKMAVLGHLRHCRPGRPLLDGVLSSAPEPRSAAPRPTSSVLHLPSPSEVSDILAQMQAQMYTIQAQQQQIGRAVGNHIQHLSAQSAAKSTQSSNIMPWVLGGIGLLGLAAALAPRQSPPRRAPLGAVPSSDTDSMCRQLLDRESAGEEVDVPQSCRDARTAHYALKAESREHRVRRGEAIADGLGVVTKAVTTVAALKKLMNS